MTRSRTTRRIAEFAADPRHDEIADDIAQHEAHAEADLADGRSLEFHVEHARGTADRPMSDNDLLDKFEFGFQIGGFEDAGALADFIMTGKPEPVGRILDSLAVRC